MRNQGKSDKQQDGGWKIKPGEENIPERYLDLEQLHKLAGKAERQHWKITSRISEYEDSRFSEPDSFKYFWKPPAITFSFGAFAVLLIIGQCWLAEICHALGFSLGEYLGFARLGMFILGAWFSIIAAPLYKPTDWTPDKQRQIDHDRQYFRGKRKL